MTYSCEGHQKRTSGGDTFATQSPKACQNCAGISLSFTGRTKH